MCVGRFWSVFGDVFWDVLENRNAGTEDGRSIIDFAPKY